MRIGLSYSRCVRDIVDEQVSINDVLIIIARTNFDPLNDEQWRNIWLGYRQRSGWSNPEWADYTDEDEERVRSVSIDLLEQGKLFQPRQVGAHPRRLPYHWLETVLPNTELDRNPTVKAAWDQFQTLAGLCGVELRQDHQ